MFLTWENSQHFEMPPLFSLENNIWGMSTEIPFWWHVTTQIWLVLGHATSLFQSNCLKQSSHITRPIGSSAQIWVVTHLHFGISVHRGNQWHLQRSAVFSGFINFLPFLWLGEGGGGDKRSARVKFSVAVATKGSSYLYTRTCIWKMCWTSKRLSKDLPPTWWEFAYVFYTSTCIWKLCWTLIKSKIKNRKTRQMNRS